MSSEIPTHVLNEFLQYGVQEFLIKQAWQRCGGQKDLLFDAISAIQDESQQLTSNTQSGPMSQEQQDIQMNQVIMQSLQEAKQHDYTIEPLNPEQRQREDKVPVGLKNVGNTCYFNSLLQIYFLNFQFVKEIFHFQEPKLVQQQGEEKQEFERKQACIKLVLNLQKLFGQMVMSDKKYVDPTEVLKSIVDDQGQQLPIGEQKDIGEFMIFFLSSLDQGLKLQEKYANKMEVEDELKNEENISFQGTDSMSQSIGSPQKMSLIRSHSSTIKEDSIINNLFFGKTETKMIYPLGDEIQTNTKNELFNIIFLDPKFKSIYPAWDENIINEIEGYKNDKGDIVSAQKQQWIKKSPSTLFFQIKRVYYDVESQMVKKNNDKFIFDKELFVDRFTNERQEEYLNIRKQVKQLQEKYDVLDQALQKIINQEQQGQQEGDEKQNVNIDSMLQNCVSFLQYQTGQQQENSILNPTFFGNLQQVSQAISVLQQYQTRVKERINDLNKQMETIKQEIEASYNNLRNNKYLLQAILVHDGVNADSGHYYSFIQDFQDNTWRRYNDQNIKPVTEEEVMKQSLGGQGYQSAYCLVYISEEQMLKEKDASSAMPLRSYSLSKLLSQNPSLVYFTIPDKLKTAIEQENLNFEQEIVSYKMQTSVKLIVDSYVQKFEYMNQSYRKLEESRKGKNNFPPAMLNYCAHLKELKNIPNLDNIIKYQILDSSVRELQDNSSIEDLSQDFRSKLETSLKSLGQFKEPPTKLLSNQQDVLDSQLADYISNISNAVTAVYFMQKILNDDYINGLKALDYLYCCNQGNNNFNNNYFFKLGKDSRQVVLIQVLIYIQKNINGLIWDNTKQLLELIVAFFKKNFQPADEVLKNNLIFWYTDLGTLVNNEEQKANIDQIKDQFNTSASEEALETLQKNIQELDDQIQKQTTESDPYNWNMNKQEDVHVNDITKNFQKYKVKMEGALAISKLFSKNEPVFKQQRDEAMPKN